MPKPFSLGTIDMAIRQFFGIRQPREIGFFDEEPPREATLQLGSFTLRKVVAADLQPGSLSPNLVAVIFRQEATKPNKISKHLKSHAPFLLTHDISVFVDPAPVAADGGTPQLRHIIVTAIENAKLPTSGLQDLELKQLGDWHPRQGDQHLTPSLHVLGLHADWSAVSTYLRDYPPGQSPSFALEVTVLDGEGNEIALPEEQTMLIKRAFYDCSSVKLIPISDGLSGVPAYRAFAFVGNDGAGRKVPYQYFVKIGERTKVSKEFLAFRDVALDHIPYHLGPRLRLDRCALGHEGGIIVSDYVGGAETLRDCARQGRAVAAIANLYNTTLRAWRDGAQTEERSMREYAIARIPASIPAHREALIRHMGCSSSVADVLAQIRSMNFGPVQIGVIHGDLHATNVLVRGHDAIVIDFEKVDRQAPSLRDVASLESGLLIDGFLGDPRDATMLLETLVCLYTAQAFFEFDWSLCHPGDRSAWFFDCIRQIRMQARQMELCRGQYALCLAAEFIRKGCNSLDFSTKKKTPGLDQEALRALSYNLGARILVNISGRQEG